MKHLKFDSISWLASQSFSIAKTNNGPFTPRLDAPAGLHGSKRVFDVVVCVLLLLPITALMAGVLLCLNPFLNRGPLFFVQDRMGVDCSPFRAIKFRSMRCEKTAEREANDPLETDRITLLGAFIRKARIDELPQIVNVLQGQMSLIGPRPDYYEHAKVFLDSIPEYRFRHAVLPGISGYAQTEVGYVEGVEATRRKVQADLYYIANRSYRMEAWLVWRTLKVIFGRVGS